MIKLEGYLDKINNKETDGSIFNKYKNIYNMKLVENKLKQNG
jgi:hypothetical protein